MKGHFDVYLTTAMYYSYGQTVAVRRRMIYGLDDIYDGHMIAGDECGPNFLTFVLHFFCNLYVGTYVYNK